MQIENINAEAARILSAGPDRWSQLGLPRGSDFAVVKQRYKRLCALHPDKNLGNALAAEAFAVVSAAYAELSQLLAPGPAAPPLHAVQAEVSHGNRWQVFTGRQQQCAQQQQQQQQPPQQAQHHGGFDSSQENRTPGTSGGGRPGQLAAAAGGAGRWRANRWGQPASSALLRAQPVAAVPASGPPGSAPGSSTDQEQQAPQSAGPGSSRRFSLSSSGLSGDSDSSDGEEAAGGGDTLPGPSSSGAQPNAAGTGVPPAAFYSKANRQCSPAVAAAPAIPTAALQPGAASLYGVFCGWRSSGGQHSGWLGSQQPALKEWLRSPAVQPDNARQHPAHPQPDTHEEQQQHLPGRHAWGAWRSGAPAPAPQHAEQQQGPWASQEPFLPRKQTTWQQLSPPLEMQEPQRQPAAAWGAQAAAGPGGGAAGGQAGSRWGARNKLELLKRPAVLAVPAGDTGGSGGPTQPAGEEQQRQQAKGSGAGRPGKRRQPLVLSSSSSSEGGTNSAGNSDSSDEEIASEVEPDPAATMREQLLQAVQQREAAERRAAQAVGAAIARQGRDKALQQWRKKWRKKAGGGSAKVKSEGSGRGGGKKGSGAASGGGKRQTQLQLTVVRPPTNEAEPASP